MLQAEPTVGTSSHRVDLSISDQAFGVEVKDDSALPEIKSGEMLVVDPAADVLCGKLVLAVIERDKAAVIGRYRKRDAEGHDDCFAIEPINPDYPRVVINDGNPGFVVGRVVQHYRRLD